MSRVYCYGSCLRPKTSCDIYAGQAKPALQYKEYYLRRARICWLLTSTLSPNHMEQIIAYNLEKFIRHSLPNVSTSSFLEPESALMLGLRAISPAKEGIGWFNNTRSSCKLNSVFQKVIPRTVAGHPLPGCIMTLAMSPPPEEGRGTYCFCNGVRLSVQ